LTKILNNIDIEDITSSLDSANIKHVITDDGVETAQCYTYAEGYNSQLYMLMTLTYNEHNNKYILGYPKFSLDDDEDPELVIENFFKKTAKRVPPGLKSSIKLITISGVDSNILVIATKIHSKKKKTK
jgi:hypothetical protein